MKRKRWVAVFLSLVLILSMGSPVSAKGYSKNSNNSGNKYSWSQTNEKSSANKKETSANENVSDNETMSDDSIVDETTGSVDEIVAEDEVSEEETVTDSETVVEGTPEETVPTQEPDPEDVPTYMEGSMTGNDGVYTVTVNVGTDAQIPEGSSVSVKELTEEDEVYQQAKEQVQVSEDDGFAALDISILDAEGNEIEPAAAVEVEIQMSQLPENVDADTEITVSHIDESTGTAVVQTVADTADETEGTVEVTEDAAVINFAVESFSTFTITYDTAEDAVANDEIVVSDETEIYVADDRAAGSVTLSFDRNQGWGAAPNSITGAPGTVVQLPNYTGTRSGYEFIGWAETSNTFPGGTEYRAVYKAGSYYELPDDDTILYAAWQSARNADTTAYFFIRTDGTIPYEPGSYASSAYTYGIRISNVVTVQNWVMDNDTTKDVVGNCVNNDVVATLKSTPTDEQITAACARSGITYDPDEYYILWYVQKYQAGATYISGYGTQTTNANCWHIDGVLLRKDLVSISYNANVPAGVSAQVSVPLGYQVPSGTEVQIGENSSTDSNDFSNSTPSLAGYTFMGWCTNPDGTGTIYQPEDIFVLEQDTTMYAIWSKSGNLMTLTKVDGMDNPLSGASFTITGGANPISFTTTDSGIYTNRNIETDTVYTVTETAAPAGYDTLAGSFNFVITSDGENLDAYICNANKEPVEAPDGVTLNYMNGTVNITVTNIGYFYIFHTADVKEGISVEEIPIISDSDNPNWNEDGTYNIVNETTKDFLYGGYYKDYAGKGAYSDENRDDLSESETYKGDQSSWDGNEAYTENGTAMTPVAGTTYYLKEVPNTYLHPATYIVYDKIDNNQIVQLYLITATDDQNYSSAGFDVTLNGITVGDNENSNSEVVAASLFDQVTVKKDGQDYQTLDAETVFSDLESGYLAISANKLEYIVPNANYVEKPYWVTLDGVKVTGNQNLKVYLRNTTYKEGWKLPGITKTAQTAVPTVTYVGIKE